MSSNIQAPIPLSEIETARKNLADSVVRTPMVKMDMPQSAVEIHLKLESLQPIGSFKIRGAGNAIAHATGEQLQQGIVTASAGNMAQGVAWHARRLGVPCHVVVPDHAPDAKRQAIRRLGGQIKPVPFDVWWQVIQTSNSGLPGYFVHPVSDPHVIAGNATIGLEILADLPDVEAIFVPFGGGGLLCGIGSALRASSRADVDLLACEVATGAPLSRALQAGRPIEVPYTPSFVDGIGSTSVLGDMWPLVHQLVRGSVVCELDAISDAIRTLAERQHVIAEGAGATALAAALQTQGYSKVACIISGGNLDLAKLATILAGQTPR